MKNNKDSAPANQSSNPIANLFWATRAKFHRYVASVLFPDTPEKREKRAKEDELIRKVDEAVAKGRARRAADKARRAAEEEASSPNTELDSTTLLKHEKTRSTPAPAEELRPAAQTKNPSYPESTRSEEEEMAAFFAEMSEIGEEAMLERQEEAGKATATAAPETDWAEVFSAGERMVF